ncbi:hypothetical protein [Pseudonocardia phyllosphaerae]|uniref:hypothetical protein n=1 Tax=Pseudonocardia phyllosphaerae TaxID=3390502 RepID=UPI00397CE3B3
MTDTILFDTSQVVIAWTDPDDFIRQTTDLIQGNKIPGVYVHNGTLVEVARVQGLTGDEGRRVVPLSAASLRRLIAEHVVAEKRSMTRDGEKLSPGQPTGGAHESVISGNDWSGTHQLVGINAVPVIMDDGSVKLERGWSSDTRRYYHPTRGVPALTSVEDARGFLLDEVTRDLPFASDADRANYLALLFTPLVREYLTRDGSAMHVPGALINAAEAGTGKSLAADLIGASYGSTKRPWSASEEEIRKTVPAALSDPNPVVIVDNLKRGTTLASSAVENMLTSNVYTDRVLGRTDSIAVENRKLWLFTGNNVTAETEMAARLVPVRLDAKSADPAGRPQSGFAIPNLDTWITNPDNQTRLLSALVTLVSAWVVDGHPRDGLNWRSFSTWASAMGGFLDWLGVPGFLDNRKTFEETSGETEELDDVLTAWDACFGDQKLNVRRFRDVLTSDTHSDSLRTLRDNFRARDGSVQSETAVGRWLRAQVGRVSASGLQLRNPNDAKGNPRLWCVSRV